MSRIFWDTNIFIYILEAHAELGPPARSLRERMLERKDQLYTSTLTLGEVLVRPLRDGRTDIVQRYEAALSSPAVVVIPFDREPARIYAQIRQDKTIRSPDAIQLACAARASCDLFITNDDRLSRKVIPGVHFIVSLQRAFL